MYKFPDVLESGCLSTEGTSGQRVVSGKQLFKWKSLVSSWQSAEIDAFTCQMVRENLLTMPTGQMCHPAQKPLRRDGSSSVWMWSTFVQLARGHVAYPESHLVGACVGGESLKDCHLSRRDWINQKRPLKWTGTKNTQDCDFQCHMRPSALEYCLSTLSLTA